MTPGLEVAREGLARSLPGFDHRDLVTASVATGQALFWACSIDEQLGGDRDYLRKREADAAGRLLPALRMARNAVAHGAAVCVRATEGLVWPIVFPARWGSLVWAPTSSVVDALSKPPKRAAVELYSAELERRDVDRTFAAVADWFDRATI